ncbi:MAG: hypothetical protein JNM93_10540 [Bacteriovoracaceae bacterium]|nr:hypothetical protein [Bacteriovoracaceae bacterium]
MEHTQYEKIATDWIESLAMDEINMEESGVINFHEHLNPERILEESSIEFMNNIREFFEIYVSKFNEYRAGKDNRNSIKIFKISNTVNDFMLFRNALKLVVARRSNDVITIGFLSNAGGLFSARLGSDAPSINTVHEIQAQVGAFGEVQWRFRGESIKQEALVRHYLTEFIKHSAR